MIDQFLIFRPSGIVEFNYQPGKNLSHIINSFIEDVLVSERKIKPVAGSEIKEEQEGEDDEIEEEQLDDNEYQTLGSYSLDNSNLKYLVYRNQSTSKKHEKLVFVTIYSSLLNLRQPYDFLRDVKNLYLNSSDPEKFDQFFNLRLKKLQTSTKSTAGTPKEETSATEFIELKTEKVTKKNKSAVSSKSGKKSRKWNADGTFYEGDVDTTALDFSKADEDPSNVTTANLDKLVGNKDKFGKATESGEFLVSDLSDEMNKILLSKPTGTSKKAETPSSSKPFGFLRNLIGGKTITKGDINKVKTALSQHLIKKNVSPNIANSLIAEIEKDLIGSKTQNFTSVEETANQSLKQQLIKLLTPNSSINLLNEIQSKKSKGEPYVISVVGVNGVGKSTNLSKLAYWLLQNNYRVLITACDTFRSGAVEQLRTHVNNLTKLAKDKNQIELFQSGYGGSDLVAKIAIGAIKHAKTNGFDVVLMDTAGRRHNDTQLMAPLASFAKAANPDKIIMVGEALVGSDSVMQALNFNKAFGANRELDFFIVSKCDTVGDLIGSMVNMVYATGIPILFVGTGQTYTDLRTLSVDWAVNMLMS